MYDGSSICLNYAYRCKINPAEFKTNTTKQILKFIKSIVFGLRLQQFNIRLKGSLER